MFNIAKQESVHGTHKVKTSPTRQNRQGGFDTLETMIMLKENVHLSEVIACFEDENRGAKAFEYTKGLLAQTNHEVGGSWTLVRLTEEDIWNILLPDHRRPAENSVELISKRGLSVSNAAARVKSVTQETGDCWNNIDFRGKRDLSALHIFLHRRNGVLANLDGLDRLLAWAVFAKENEIRAYIIGLATA